MAAHDFIVGQNADVGIGRSDGLDIDLEHAHGLVHEFNLELDRPTDLNQPHDGMRLLGFDYGNDSGGEIGHCESHGSGSGLSDNRELALVENCGIGDSNDTLDDFTIDDSQHLTLQTSNFTLDHFTVDQNEEMALQYQTNHDLQFRQLVPQRAITVIPGHELTVGKEFADVKSCRRALRDAAIACNFEIQTVKSDKSRFTAKCAVEGCPWRIHCAKLPGVPNFTVRTIQETHTCGGIAHLGHQQASVEWVANTVEERLRENPHCKPKELLEDIHKMHGITLSYKQAWRGKERILAAVRGSFEDGYRLLPQYCEQVKMANPGSMALVLDNHEDNSFKCLFISYYALIYGFVNACCPLIGIDKTVMKSKYLGTLLIATGFDGDGSFFPLAFGVVNEESEENWIWFLSELRSLLEANTENMPRLTILSDRRKGIVEGVDFNFPTAFHGFCMRHLTESFRKEFNNHMLVNLLWEAAQALTSDEFAIKMAEIESISEEGALWIKRIPYRLWATAYFEGVRFGNLTASIAESLESWIVEASGLPIIQMMESIRRQLMTWFNERRELSMQWSSILVPSVEQRVSSAQKLAQGYHVVRASEAGFEVTSLHEGTKVVDIRNRCCACRGWQVYGFPCAHAVAALQVRRQNVNRFTENYFLVATYRKCYSETIHPIPDQSLWKEVAEGIGHREDRALIVINPPKSLRTLAKPRKRKVQGNELVRGKRTVHCSRCNQIGHFRSTCSVPY